MSDYVKWLAGLSSDQLARILEQRPDLLEGPPLRDLSALESRLAHPSSLSLALVQQPRPVIQALSALLSLGGRAPLSRCAGLLAVQPGTGRPGRPDHLDQVEYWLAVAGGFGLAWRDDAGIAYAAPGLSNLLASVDFGPSMLELSQFTPRDRLAKLLRHWTSSAPRLKDEIVAELLACLDDSVAVQARLDLLTPANRQALTTWVQRTRDSVFGYSGIDYRAVAGALDAATQYGLAVPSHSAMDAVIPAEVAVELLQPSLTFDPQAPLLPESQVEPEMVRRESAAALVQFDQACLSLVDHVRDHPVATLKAGGVGQREITRLAKVCHLDQAMVRLVLQLTYAAGVLEQQGGRWRCGETASAWRDLDPGPRITLLIEAWTNLGQSPTAITDAQGRPGPVGHDSDYCILCQSGRSVLLAAYVALPPGRAVEEQAMIRQVEWTKPLLHLRHVEEEFDEPDELDAGPAALRESPPPSSPALDEARMLGLIAHGAASEVLRASFAAERTQLVEAVAAVLPAVVGVAVFGSDLTAMAAGPPSGRLSTLLDLSADRESRGGAVIWRFTTATVRRALDSGVGAAELAAQLTAVATGPLPQPLEYLIADVGRRHGGVRVAPARSVLRCDDEALLVEICSERRLRELRLQRIAPTVALSEQGPEATLNALRAAGFLPMPWQSAPHETSDRPRSAQNAADTGEDGVVIDLAVAQQPAPQADGPLRTGWGRENVADVVRRLAGVIVADEDEDDVLGYLVAKLRMASRHLGEDELRTLAMAIAQGANIFITYRSAGGGVSDRVITVRDFAADRLFAWCHEKRDERQFLIASILSVSTA